MNSSWTTAPRRAGDWTNGRYLRGELSPAKPSTPTAGRGQAPVLNSHRRLDELETRSASATSAPASIGTEGHRAKPAQPPRIRARPGARPRNRVIRTSASATTRDAIEMSAPDSPRCGFTASPGGRPRRTQPHPIPADMDARSRNRERKTSLSRFEIPHYPCAVTVINRAASQQTPRWAQPPKPSLKKDAPCPETIAAGGTTAPAQTHRNPPRPPPTPAPPTSPTCAPATACQLAMPA